MSLEHTLDVEVFCNGVLVTPEMAQLDEAEIKRIVQDIVWSGAARIAELARAAAPVRTGRLRDSIEAVMNENGATVMCAAPYAAAVNYGHLTASGSFVAANPFLSSAIESVLPEITRQIDEEVNAYLRMEKRE